MDVCCVQGCTSVNKQEDIYYFEFPLSRALRRKWLDVIKIGSKVPLGTLVCSQHFNVNDYETIRGKVRLKKKVVPSLVHNITVEKESENIIEQPSNASELVDKEIPEVPKDITADTPLDKPQDSVETTNLDTIVDKRELIKDKESDQKESESPKLDVVCEKRDSSDRELQSKKETENGASLVTVTDRRETEGRESPEICKVVNKDNGGDLARSNERNLEAPDPKQPPDFEEMITNYHIKINKPNVLRSEEMEIETPPVRERDSAIVVDDTGDSPPVFIEISTDKDANPKNSNSQDCLMVLESVQVEVDPTSLMLPERDFEETKSDTDSDVEINMPDQKVDPISLLTSSDEDDVILQEPKIDTVEVSDETDEDDMPLVKLVKKKPLKKRSVRQPKLGPMNGQDLRNIIWSGDYGFYCVQCNFSTTDSVVYASHLEEHERALHVCSICSYTTSSKKQYSRHVRKHKEEKKFKCHICDYRARHNMSLLYHLQSHSQSKSDIECFKKGFKCVKCSYRSDYKGDVVKHLKLCTSVKKHRCSLCEYSSKRKSDLKRHWTSRHSAVVEVESDGSYKPAGWE